MATDSKPKAAPSDGNDLNKKYTPFRLSTNLLARLKKMQDAETRKLQYPISRADVMRKCLTVGLAQWERSEAGGSR
jgi:hypothetical protein